MLKGVKGAYKDEILHITPVFCYERYQWEKQNQQIRGSLGGGGGGRVMSGCLIIRT